STRRSRMLGALLLGSLALATRSANYPYFPRLAGDELGNAWAGWNLLHEGRPKGWSRLPVYPESEIATWFGRSFPIIPEAFEHPPLLPVVLGAASTLAGAENMYQNTPGRYRPPMIVFGSIGVVLLFLIAARLSDFRTAFLVGALMAVSPLAVFSARLAKEDGLVQLLWLAGLWIYLHIREKESAPAWDCLLGAILGLATLSKIPGLVLGLAFAVTAVVDGRNYRRAARLLSVSLAVGALFPLYGYVLNAGLFHDVMAYMGGRFSVEDVSQKLLIIPRFILEPKLGAGVPFVDGWILLGWLSLPFLFSKKYLSIPFVSYLFVLALAIHSERQYGFYLIPVFPILLLGAALGIRRAFLRPAVLPTFLFVTLVFLLPAREIASSLPFGARTLLFAAYLPVALVFLRDMGWRAAEPIRLAMLGGMVVLGFLFAVHQCFSTI
ncbi:MAG: glycosyltransferase family 39 protein, partial [Vicinamibacteria bacterium]